jgi:hypothetical protein
LKKSHHLLVASLLPLRELQAAALARQKAEFELAALYRECEMSRMRRAAVDGERLAGEKCRGVGGQEQDAANQVFRHLRPRNACIATMRSFCSGVTVLRSISVEVAPGRIALTVIPSRPSSRAIDRVIPTSAALDVM